MLQFLANNMASSREKRLHITYTNKEIAIECSLGILSILIALIGAIRKEISIFLMVFVVFVPMLMIPISAAWRRIDELQKFK